MDDIDSYYLLDNALINFLRIRKRRMFWMNPILTRRQSLGEFNHLHDELKGDSEKFRNYYRMDLQTYDYILNAIQASITKSSNFRDTISPAERLSVTLRYLATGCSFVTLGYSFRMSDTTVGRVVKETCEVIWEKLSATHMPCPTTDDLHSIAQEFWNKWGFPNCVGCIDGKHVRVRNPQHAGTMYRNYKQFFSIVLQGVAGPDYKFIAIDVGAYGKESDGGIFSHSKLSTLLENGALGVHRHAVLPGTNVAAPHVLLGDEAYPLKPYLMRPFPVSQLGAEQRIFNRRLSRARQVIECTFGIMSAKWRVIPKGIEVEPEFADVIVQCVCLLHNIIIDKEGNQQVAAFQEVAEQPQRETPRFSTMGENRSVNAAFSIREKFLTFFCAH